MSQRVQLSSISQASQLSQVPNREQIRDNVDENAHLVPPHAAPRNSFRIKNIVKSLILATMMVVLIWVISYIFSDEFLRSRVPSSLQIQTIFSNKKPEIISPMELDYISYKNFLKMTNLAIIIEKEQREPNAKELKQFQNLQFQSVFDIFKVAKTIQLAKNYSATLEQNQQNYAPDEEDLQIQRNFTQYFLDAVDQHRCASCYSFPITATIEFQYKFRYNMTLKLSEQQLIDCGHQDPDKNGCQDGNITQGFEYARTVGLVNQSDYPYQSIVGKSFPCKHQIVNNPNITKYKISGFKTLPYGKCDYVKKELVQNHTVAVIVNVGNLGNYQKGSEFFDCSRTHLNHAVTVVGQTNTSAWIIRNSWGKGWGDNGYYLVQRGNTCGVCMHAFSPRLIIEKGNVLEWKEENEKQEKTNENK